MKSKEEIPSNPPLLKGGTHYFCPPFVKGAAKQYAAAQRRGGFCKHHE